MSNKYQSTKKETCVSCNKIRMRLDMFKRKLDKKWFCREHIKIDNLKVK